ncbi:hypothetical protein Taro_038166, partial [Colocasia esculenta]|nr:hypothetical protein [Colocasia esculenta]
MASLLTYRALEALRPTWRRKTGDPEAEWYRWFDIEDITIAFSRLFWEEERTGPPAAEEFLFPSSPPLLIQLTPQLLTAAHSLLTPELPPAVLSALQADPGDHEHAYLLGASHLRIIGDSQLILRQVLSTYRTRDLKLKPYQDLVTLLARQFRKLVYIHTPRSQNILADTLASLVSSLSFPLSRRTETIVVQRLNVPSTQDPWFSDLRATLEERARKRGAQ